MMVTRQKLAEEMGVTVDTLRGWQAIHWKPGLHYVVIGKTTLLDRAEIEAWLKQRKTKHLTSATT
jgi:hypothetical protein